MESVTKAKKYIKSLENEKVTKKPLIVDCDPGIDDALALVLLSENLDKFDLKLICSCAGNTPIELTTKNIQFFAENFFNGVTVARGSKNALVKVKDKDASDVHGKSGMGDFFVGEQIYPVKPNAVEEMKNVLTKATEPVTIVAFGPLTNVAKLVINYPELKSKVEKIYTMIGSINGNGNVTPYSEFNSYFDPEAFYLVSKCGIPLVINPMELGVESRIKKTVFANMPTKTIKDNLVKTLAESIYEPLDPTSICLFDPNTVVGLTHPEFYDFVPCDVLVYTDPKIGGKTILSENKNSKSCYQKVKNQEELNKYIIKTLFER